MAKAYWIGCVEVNNEERHKPYAAANPAMFKTFTRFDLIIVESYGGPQP